MWYITNWNYLHFVEVNQEYAVVCGGVVLGRGVGMVVIGRCIAIN